jgi:peptide/nickel transport system permease protein
MTFTEIAAESGVPEAATGGVPRRPPGAIRSAMRMWRTRIGMLLVGVVIFLAVFGPSLAPNNGRVAVGSGKPFDPDADGALFGSGYLGSDVWSRFLNGGRAILITATIATMLAIAVGAGLGLLAAYSRGTLDNVIMRSLDIVLAFPSLLLALVIFTTYGVENWLIVLVVAGTTTPRIARVVRGATVPVVERDFVGAAEALGESRWFIITRELLPNVTAPLLVEASLRLAYSIALISTLGFLGFTESVNAPNWGVMVQEGRATLEIQPWAVMIPVIAIAILTIGAGLIADGITRANAGIDRGRADA